MKFSQIQKIKVSLDPNILNKGKILMKNRSILKIIMKKESFYQTLVEKRKVGIRIKVKLTIL